MEITTFIGYVHIVQKFESEPYYELMQEKEEYLVPVDEFISELQQYKQYSTLADSISKSDVTDVLLLRGW